MSGKADLHMHSSYSDGTYSPYELIKRAKSAGIEVLSITDHDSVSGIDEAIAVGKEFDVKIVPGIELSASVGEKEIHILGYFVNYQHPDLLESLAEFRTHRHTRAERIVSKLNKMNIPLKLESVIEEAGDAAIGRVHIANAMVRSGHANSYQQVFNKYIGDGCPAFERKPNTSPEETIQLIAAAGGISFLAHAGRSMDESQVLDLIKAGLDGIEVVHPSHTPDLIKYYRKIVHEYFLLESGGSDFHGGFKGDDNLLGAMTIPVETVDAMRTRLFLSGSRS